MSNNLWIAVYFFLAIIGTVELLASDIARSFANAQSSLAQALAQTQPSNIVVRILGATTNAATTNQGRPLFVVILIALATYSMRIYGAPLSFSVDGVTPRSGVYAGISFLIGLFLSSRILGAPQSVVRHYETSLFATVVRLGIRSTLGFGLAIGAAGIAGFIYSPLLGAAGWIAALLLAVSLFGWAVFFCWDYIRNR